MSIREEDALKMCLGHHCVSKLGGAKALIGCV